MPEDGEAILKVEHGHRELLDMFNTDQPLHCAPDVMLEVVELHIPGQVDEVRGCAQEVRVRKEHD